MLRASLSSISSSVSGFSAVGASGAAVAAASSVAGAAQRNLYNFSASAFSAAAGASAAASSSSALGTQIQMRSYAQKKKESAKKKQAQERERARKQKLESELRTQKMLLERQAKRAAKAKSGETSAIQQKPKIVEEPAKPSIKIAVAVNNAEKKSNEAVDRFAAFVSTLRNVDLSSQALSNDGSFGVAYLSSGEALEQHIFQLKSNIEGAVLDLQKRAAAGPQASSTPDAVTEILNLFDLIETPRYELARVRAAVQALHPDTDLVAQVINAEQSLLNFYKQRVDENDALYQVIKAITDNTTLFETLAPKNQIFVQRLKSRFEFNGLHLESTEAKQRLRDLQALYQSNVAAYMEAVDAASNIVLPRPSRLYELPRAIYDTVSKRKLKKTQKQALLDAQAHLMPILEYVSNENVRKQLFTATRELVATENSRINALLQAVVSTADQLCSHIGYRSLGTLSLRSQGIQDVDSHFNDVNEVFSQVVSQLNGAAEVDLLKKQTGKEEVAPQDTRYMFQHYKEHTLRKYDAESTESFFPVSRCLQGLQQLTRDLFGLELRSALMTPGETWEPRSIKKLELVDSNSGAVIGKVYLDLFARRGDERKPLQATSYPVPGTPTTMVISMNLGENLYSVPDCLSHNELRHLLREYGNALSSVFAAQQVNFGVVKSHAQNTIVRNLLGHVMEKFAFVPSFLTSFARHKGAQVPIFQEYVSDLVNRPAESKLKVIDEVVYALYDAELFVRRDLKAKSPAAVLNTLESSLVPLGQAIPDLRVWKNMTTMTGSTYMDLYARICAAHVFNVLLKSGAANAAAGGLKLRETLADGSLAPTEVLESLMGQRRPDVSHFVRYVEQQKQ